MKTKVVLIVTHGDFGREIVDKEILAVNIGGEV